PRPRVRPADSTGTSVGARAHGATCGRKAPAWRPIIETRTRGNGAQAAHGVIVLDERQRVLEWDRGAAEFLGVPLGAAGEFTCYEVVGGTSSTCGPDCPAFARLTAGRLRAESTVTREDGSRLTCRLTALAGSMGGAVANLSH